MMYKSKKFENVMKKMSYQLNMENGEVEVVSIDRIVNLLSISSEEFKDSILKDLYCQESLFSFWVNNQTNISYEKILQIHNDMKTVNMIYFEGSLIFQLGNGDLTIWEQSENITYSLLNFLENKKAKQIFCSNKVFVILDVENNLHIKAEELSVSFILEVLEFSSCNKESIKNVYCTDNCICFLLEDKKLHCFISEEEIKTLEEENVINVICSHNKVIVEKNGKLFKFLFKEQFIDLPGEIDQLTFSENFIAGIHSRQGIALIPTERIEFNPRALFEKLSQKIKHISVSKTKISVINENGIFYSFDLEKEKTFEVVDAEYNFDKVICNKELDIVFEGENIYVLKDIVVKLEDEEEKFENNEKYQQIKHLVEGPKVLDYMLNDDIFCIKKSYYISPIFTMEDLKQFIGM